MSFAKRIDFNRAVAAGIIDADTALRLADFYADAIIEPASDPDDESFRLITGFNDVFVTTGILLVFGALSLFGALGAVVVAITAWGLAEIFTRRRRMALPSIVLAVCFVFSVVPVAGMLTGARDELFSGAFLQGAGGLLSALTIVAAAAAHYRRFHVAIDVSLGVCGVGLALLWALLNAAPLFAATHHGAIAFAYGLAVFLLAMHFDRSDPERKTHRADIAFWLHLQAAPFAANGLLGGVMAGGLHEKMSTGAALLTLTVATLFALVAIIVDRRALIVSSLAYVGAALLMLLSNDGHHDSSPIFVVMLVGAAVLALSIGWRHIRQRLLCYVPLDLAKAGLPPLHAESR